MSDKSITRCITYNHVHKIYTILHAHLPNSMYIIYTNTWMHIIRYEKTTKTSLFQKSYKQTKKKNDGDGSTVGTKRPWRLTAKNTIFWEVWFRSFSFLFMGDGCRWTMFQPFFFQSSDLRGTGVAEPNLLEANAVTWTLRRCRRSLGETEGNETSSVDTLSYPIAKHGEKWRVWVYLQ